MAKESCIGVSGTGDSSEGSSGGSAATRGNPDAGIEPKGIHQELSRGGRDFQELLPHSRAWTRVLPLCVLNPDRYMTVTDMRSGHGVFRHVITRDSFEDTDPSAHNFI